MRTFRPGEPATHAATLTVVAIAWVAVLGHGDAASLAVVAQRVAVQSQSAGWTQSIRRATPQPRTFVQARRDRLTADPAPLCLTLDTPARPADAPRVDLLNLPPPSA